MKREGRLREENARYVTWGNNDNVDFQVKRFVVEPFGIRDPCASVDPCVCLPHVFIYLLG